MNNSTPTRTRSPSPTPGRSFLSKLKSPFGSKARNISEFYVQPDDPHRQYAPGDVITGSVVLKIIKPLRITHLVVCLHGYVQVYKTPNSPGEGYRTYGAALAQGKTRKAGGYYGNGFASLFEDEVILCGDGRLGEGTYQFNFELELPRERLPSSIDFERGKICYMITATLTRPTAIAPTTSCDRRIDFQEQIDIATLYKPKPRIISLEPISRRSRTRRKTTISVTAPDKEKQGDSERTSVESSTEQSTIDATSTADAEPPHSSSPSRLSFDSCSSSRETGSVVDSNSISARTGDSKLGRSKHAHGHLHAVLKPITAKIELQRAGFLRGDNVPVNITVNHTKPVKSLHGVIVTFYRQARVDYQPNLTRVGSAKTEDEEIYPRTKSGLGGLSMSSTNTSHLFRKDLSQSFASLIINPNTLTAEVKATVRVPDGAFPSISNVPGAMISFRYYVEVVLDLQNKLAGLDRFLPNAGMSGVSTHAEMGMPIGGAASHSVFAPWGGHFIDTEEIRRDKSVVSCVFEVMIGTTDSERKGKWKALAGPAEIVPQDQAEPTHQQAQPHQAHHNGETPQYTENGDYRNYPPEPYDFAHSITETPPPPIHTVAIPDIAADEQHLSEKERLRRAEERLLPSRPPESSEASSAGASLLPSAPPLDLDECSAGATLPAPNEHTPFAPTADALYGPSGSNSYAYPTSHLNEGPSAPAYIEHAGPSNYSTAGPSFSSHSAPGSSHVATNTNPDLERPHLESEASAPPAQNSEPESRNFNLAAGPAAPSEPLQLPTPPNHELTQASAPTLEELSLGFNTEETRHNEHPLPRYEV